MTTTYVQKRSLNTMDSTLHNEDSKNNDSSKRSKIDYNDMSISELAEIIMSSAPQNNMGTRSDDDDVDDGDDGDDEQEKHKNDFYKNTLTEITEKKAEESDSDETVVYEKNTNTETNQQTTVSNGLSHKDVSIDEFIDMIQKKHSIESSMSKLRENIDKLSNNDYSLIDVACKNNFTELIEFLLCLCDEKQKRDVSNKIFEKACSYGRLELAQSIYSNNTDVIDSVNTNNIAINLSKLKNKEMYRWFMKIAFGVHYNK